MKFDAIVVGSGPNGMAAAITLARAGLSVKVFEAAHTVGGGARSGEITLPGFTHDICSAVYPFAVISPFFQLLALEKQGLNWIYPNVQLAHPLDNGKAVLLHKNILDMSEFLGADIAAYKKLFDPLISHSNEIFSYVLGPLKIPRHPFILARFGVHAIRSAEGLCKIFFKNRETKALFGGIAAHSFLPLNQAISAAAGLLLALAGHVEGWPIPKGGSQRISNALLFYLKSLKGEIELDRRILSIEELPSSDIYMFDTSPRQLVSICGNKLPSSYLKKLFNFRYGSAIFKMDFALSEPVPWKAWGCDQSATLHVAGGMEEIAQCEKDVSEGKNPESPFVLVAQPSLFDSLRAPDGKHVLWAYCHVPSKSDFDMSERIENQIERFAPGFRQVILAKKKTFPSDLEAYNPNDIGGAITGGVMDWRQLFTRPVARINPYSTPAKGIYICSSSTPPGAGVHGMCGYLAAKSALDDLKKRKKTPIAVPKIIFKKTKEDIPIMAAPPEVAPRNKQD